VLAGAGIRAGQVVGATSRDGGEVQDQPIRPQDLMTTIYATLGIAMHTQFQDRQNGPVPIVPDGKVVAELLG